MNNTLFPLVGFPFILLIALQFKALSYPAVEMQACISNATNAVLQRGISTTYKRVQQYCDCSLRRIIDEGREINTSISYCNKKYIF
jgi:hypothetical protein